MIADKASANGRVSSLKTKLFNRNTESDDNQAAGAGRHRQSGTSMASTLEKAAPVLACLCMGLRRKTVGTPQPFSTFTFQYKNKSENSKVRHENERKLTEYREFRKRTNLNEIMSNTVGI
jgi:hypothetical protein